MDFRCILEAEPTGHSDGLDVEKEVPRAQVSGLGSRWTVEG